MTNIYKFNGYTKNKINHEDVLDSAKGQCETVLVIGFDESGSNYMASSTGDVGVLLRMIETFKFKLLNGDFD